MFCDSRQKVMALIILALLPYFGQTSDKFYIEIIWLRVKNLISESGGPRHRTEFFDGNLMREKRITIGWMKVFAVKCVALDLLVKVLYFLTGHPCSVSMILVT